MSFTRFRPSSALRASLIMYMTHSFAPPCKGPLKAPIAPEIHEYVSLSVLAITREVKVEAAKSCSA